VVDNGNKLQISQALQNLHNIGNQYQSILDPFRNMGGPARKLIQQMELISSQHRIMQKQLEVSGIFGSVQRLMQDYERSVAPLHDAMRAFQTPALNIEELVKTSAVFKLQRQLHEIFDPLKLASGHLSLFNTGLRLSEKLAIAVNIQNAHAGTSVVRSLLNANEARAVDLPLKRVSKESFVYENSIDALELLAATEIISAELLLEFFARMTSNITALAKKNQSNIGLIALLIGIFSVYLDYAQNEEMNIRLDRFENQLGQIKSDAENYFDGDYAKTNRSCYLRASPDARSLSIVYLYRMQPLKVLSLDGAWVKVEYLQPDTQLPIIGYVHRNYLSKMTAKEFFSG
jgi:hypothetical protein